jgi:hypothetical protein
MAGLAERVAVRVAALFEKRDEAEECLERMIFFGEGALRTAIREYLVHYHAERNHQGLSTRLIIPNVDKWESDGVVHRKQRLRGTFNFYHCDAA